MFSIMAAAALAAAPTPQTIAADPDVRCYLAMTLALAGLGKSGEGKMDEMVGLTAIVWYYYGRMETSYPGIDLAPGLVILADRPNYATDQLQEDAARCGAEAERKGKEMQGLGERMQRLVPLADGKAG